MVNIFPLVLFFCFLNVKGINVECLRCSPRKSLATKYNSSTHQLFPIIKVNSSHRKGMWYRDEQCDPLYSTSCRYFYVNCLPKSTNDVLHCLYFHRRRLSRQTSSYNQKKSPRNLRSSKNSSHPIAITSLASCLIQ